MKKYLRLLGLLLVLGLFIMGQSGCTGCGGGGVTGDTTKPDVAITSPTDGTTVFGTVTIRATATDNVGVVKVEFYIDGSKVGEDASSPYEYSWNTDTLTYGSTHTIQAKAYDNAGNVGDSPIVTVTIGDPNAPEVTITNPNNGDTVSGTVLIQTQVIERSKKPKAPSGIQRVEFYIDGSKVGEDTSSPYEYSWNTTQYTSGDHTIQAKAYDNAGNVGESPIVTVTIQAVTIQKAWNFLVYLDGDNNLESYAIKDMNEMEQVGSTDQVNILVLVDRTPGYDSSNGDWTTTRLYYITKDNDTSTINSTLLADFGELDMSDPNTLRDFIIYCTNNFPADKTCLTLWNHGGGVWPRSYSTSKKDIKSGTNKVKGGLRGICWDDTTSGYPWNCLTTDEVRIALSQARAQTGKKIDVINMDACLTQMLEVAWEWQDEASYLVGSEETVPGDGNDYATVLQHLTSNPNMSTEDFAKTLVDDYYNYYSFSGLDTTYSYINLGTPFTELKNRFTAFAQAVYSISDSEMATIYDIWKNYLTWFSSYENDDLYDFADELSQRSSDTNVINAANSLKIAMSNAIYYRNTGIYATSFPAYGVSILFPTGNEWQNYSGPDQYVQLMMSQETFWDEFIQRFVLYTT